MRIMLILPDAHMHTLRIGPHVRSLREAPLTHTTLAALTPPDLDVHVRVVDESVERVPLDAPVDLVGISVITGCAPRAYRLAAHFRGRGVPVVLGGVHVTILPGEARPHADCLVIGRAEQTWPRLVRDFAAGRMAAVYREPAADADGVLRDVPVARRDLQRRHGYVLPDTVQATRGCRRACDFCTVPAVWPSYLRRPVGDVIADLRSLRGRTVAFNDVSLVDDADYARELFTAMVPLRKRWGGLVTADALDDSDLLELMVRSGCRYLLVGFESENADALRAIHKGFNRPDRYAGMMRELHRRGVSVQGCFVFGFDHDDPGVFARTVQRVQDLKIDIPRYSIYTPYPGTALFSRLQAEGRILSYNWEDYDTMHVVIRPARMEPEELYAGFKWAYRETFRLGAIARRVRGWRFASVINASGNLTYRLFVRRLYGEPRFAAPYSVHAPGSPPDPGAWLDPWWAAQATGG